MPVPVTPSSTTRVAIPKSGDPYLVKTATSNRRGYVISLEKSKKLGKFLVNAARDAIRRGTALMDCLRGKSEVEKGAPRSVFYMQMPPAAAKNHEAMRTEKMPSAESVPGLDALAESAVEPQPFSRRESLASTSAILPGVEDNALSELPADASHPEGSEPSQNIASADLLEQEEQIEAVLVDESEAEEQPEAVLVHELEPEEQAVAVQVDELVQDEQPVPIQVDEAAVAQPQVAVLESPTLVEEPRLSVTDLRRQFVPSDHPLEVVRRITGTTPNLYRPGNRHRHRSPAAQEMMGHMSTWASATSTASRPSEYEASALLGFIRAARGNPEPGTEHRLGFNRPIADAAVSWYPPKMQEEVLAKWHAAAPENTQGMKALSAFLGRLGETHLDGKMLKNNASFNVFVQAWLTQLADSPELLEQTGNAAFGATETCSDRVLLTFNLMQTPRILDDVKSGEYDRRLQDLVTAGRRQFRLEHLENSAVAIVERKLAAQMRSPAEWLPSIPAQRLARMSEADIKARLRANSEELETHLYMQVGAIKMLDLEPPIASMRYAGVAGVSPAELAVEAAWIQDQENVKFAEWLSDWAPWNTFVEKQYSDEYEHMKLRKDEIADEFFDKMAGEVEAEIEAMIAAGALPTEPEAEAALARNNVDVRLSNEKWRDLGPKAMQLAMQELVEKLGHAGIMDPRWPSAA